MLAKLGTIAFAVVSEKKKANVNAMFDQREGGGREIAI